jgi:hydrogenase nickel incorporation protein HypB
MSTERDVTVIEIKKNIFEDNDREADALRETLRGEHTFLLNLMSSPGSGKTTTLVRTIEALKDTLRIGVMEADIDSKVDADTIAETGAKAIQIHTGGMCHLDADMTRQGIEALGTADIDLAILENVGNLVCPAEFDTGAVRNAMLLSVPEGDDKPLKYPLMFSVCDVLLINKIDVLPCFDFDIEACTKRAKERNPAIQVIPISAKTGEGMEAWYAWLKREVAAWQGES